MTDNIQFRERIINIDRRRVGDVGPNARNPERYTDEKNTRLTAVLSQFGKAGVLLTYFDERGVECFFDGNTRSRIDPDEVWYIAQTDLSQKEVDDLVMLYDPLAAPDWDAELFKQLMKETAVTDETLTGMMDEIAAAIGAMVAEPPESKDAEPQISRADELQKIWGVELGQMWELGNHRLYVGDSTKINPVDIFGECPNSLFFDPPWDAGILPPAGEWENTLAFCDGKRAKDIIDLFGSPTWIFVWDCVTRAFTFNRPLKGMKLCLWYGDIDGFDFDGAHWGEPADEQISKTAWGEHHYIPDPRGKHLCDIYRESIAQLHGGSELKHSHSKPIDWIRLLIGDCIRGDIYDPFIGSGVTLRAREQLGYRCFGVELSPTSAAITIQLAADFGLSVNCAGARI